MLIFALTTSCSVEERLAANFVSNTNTRSILVFPAAYIYKVNQKTEILDSLNITNETSFDSVLYAHSDYIQHLNDSLFLANYTLGYQKELMAVGFYYLNMASSGKTLTRFHLEAAIAAEHCKASKYSDTNWQQLLQWYELLLRIDSSPVILLNRSLVIHAIGETEKAIQAILAIPGIDMLLNHDPQYSAVLGYLYMKHSDKIKAKDYLQKALAITDSKAEKELLQARIDQLSIKN